MIETNKIHNIDALEGLKQIPTGSIPLIVTDPPYNIKYNPNYDGNDEEYAKISNLTDWDKDFDLKPFFDEMWRVLSDDGVIYMFGRHDTWDQYPRKPDCVLIWDKMDMQQGDLSWWSQSYEFIYVFRKNRGKAKWKGLKRPTGMMRYWKVANMSSWENNGGGDNYMMHPTQKPVLLIKNILEQHDVDLVLDPFMGSGTTAIAAIMLGMGYLGFEREKTFYDVCVRRIASQSLKLERWF